MSYKISIKLFNKKQTKNNFIKKNQFFNPSLHFESYPFML